MALLKEKYNSLKHNYFSKPLLLSNNYLALLKRCCTLLKSGTKQGHMENLRSDISSHNQQQTSNKVLKKMVSSLKLIGNRLSNHKKKN